MKRANKTFQKGDRVQFKDGRRGFLATHPELGSMGWAVFQSTTGEQFTVSTTGDELRHTDKE